jgi:phosphate transport system permease protein
MTDTTLASLTLETNNARIAKRYAAERRFQLYGLAALFVTTAFLALLLLDIVSRSMPAYFQHYAILKVMVDPEKVDPKSLAKGDFESLVKTAWRQHFPSVTSRPDRRLLNSLLSVGAAQDLKERVLADPGLIGKEVEIPVLLSDDADMHYKGISGTVRTSAGKGELKVTESGGEFQLAASELRSGQIVFAGGGAFKITRDSNSTAVEVLVKPDSGIAAVPEGSWTVLTLDTPESARKLGDKETAFLEMFKQSGAVERSLSTTLLFNGDSREAELAGIASSVVGSLMVVFVTILLSLPIGVAAAIYLEEFAPKNRFTDLIEVNINNLAAVPSIIFGLLGLAVFLNFFGMPRSIPLVGGIVIALMSLPTIIIASRAAIRAVPPSIRDAALGVGASHQQAVLHHVLPLAMPGIMTGTILAVASAIGETAPLLLIGMVAFIVDVPGGFFDPATVLPVQIYLWSDLPEKAFEARTAAAIVILLVVMVLLNAAAIFLRKRFERRW